MCVHGIKSKCQVPLPSKPAVTAGLYYLALSVFRHQRSPFELSGPFESGSQVAQAGHKLNIYPRLASNTPTFLYLVSSGNTVMWYYIWLNNYDFKLFIQTKCSSVDQTGFKLTMWTKLAPNSWQSSCFTLLSARVTIYVVLNLSTVAQGLDE